MNTVNEVYVELRTKIYEIIDADLISNTTAEQLSKEFSKAIDALIDDKKLTVSKALRSEFVKRLVDDVKGLGPLQSLMDDDSISDIMINGTDQVFIERQGLIEKSTVNFIDENQLLGIARRIASRVGRRIDESQPTCNARLADGSRVNIVIPPIAIDGTCISIRKFKKHSIDFAQLCELGTMSREMAKLLMIAARCGLNILISGGTGSGKTTLLNALSQFISEKERIITIEDVAELRLQQPHVVRLETRTAGIENTGAITQRELVINALRMRPDRIIVGECRGTEAFEMLQAMNTGHDGSMSTLHANTPGDAIGRVEAMVMMAGSNWPLGAIRRNIVSAVDLVIQISRLRDGSRKLMSITEVVGIEGENVVLQEIFSFQPSPLQDDAGKVQGKFISDGIMPCSVLMKKAGLFGMQDQLKAAFGGLA